MKVIMVGEAAHHQNKLAALLDNKIEIRTLPREAAHSDGFDTEIGAEDVVISLRFARKTASPAFRLLHVPGAGLDGIDFSTLSPQTEVCNVFEHEGAIAEYVLLAMLDWQIGLQEMRQRFTPDSWAEVYRNRAPHGELQGQTLGLLGFGRIGRAIAVRARAFGVRIIAMDPFAGNADGLADELVRPAQVATLLSEADFVVACCPLTEETRGLVNRETLPRMKRSAVFINISRAEIADEAALYEALSRGTIAGAYLDVWYAYPKDAADAVTPSRFDFHALPTVRATPHSSAWTTALPARRYGVIAQNIRRLIAGEARLNVVRPAANAEMPSKRST